MSYVVSGCCPPLPDQSLAGDVVRGSPAKAAHSVHAGPPKGGHYVTIQADLSRSLWRRLSDDVDGRVTDRLAARVEKLERLLEETRFRGAGWNRDVQDIEAILVHAAKRMIVLPRA
jgi:hypothetical protein